MINYPLVIMIGIGSFLLGIPLGMILEGRLLDIHLNKFLPKAHDVAKLVLETQLDLPGLKSLVSPEDHGHEYVIICLDGDHNQELYKGRNSDKAYEAWMELERNPNKYPGTHTYIVDGQIKATRLGKC